MLNNPFLLPHPRKKNSQASDESGGFDVDVREEVRLDDGAALPATPSGSSHGGSASGGGGGRREEYVVNIMPHPDFGLGLR